MALEQHFASGAAGAGLLDLRCEIKMIQNLPILPFSYHHYIWG